MRNSWLVAWREFAENAKTKGFWIGILVFPLILFASIQVPIMLETKGTPTRYFVLVDQSGQFQAVVEDQLEKAHQRRLLQALREYATKHGRNSAELPPKGIQMAAPAQMPAFLQDFAESNPQALDNFVRQGGKEFFLRRLQPYISPDAPKFIEPRRLFHRVTLPAGLRADSDLATLAQALKPYLRGAKRIQAGGQWVNLYAAILIPAAIDQCIVRPDQPGISSGNPAKSIEYWSGNLADLKLREEIERAVNNEIRRREYQALGMDLATIRKVERTHVPFASLNPKKAEGQETVGIADIIRQWAPSGFVYLLWVAIFSIAQMLLNNTIEEKSNRIIEVLLSSVTPGELMMGKLAGIAAVGITMVGAWILALLGILVWKTGSQSAIAGPLFVVLQTSNLLPAFAIYFLLGFLMYAGLILSIGSICNTIKEAQNYMAAIIMIMMVPLLTMMFIPKDPNGTLATVLSWIPIYTPFVMMNRATADPPLFEVIGTMILLLGTTALVLWLSGKIFRIGILRTGQPPRLLEMLRWLRG
jgi:ABC-2 type transport system permease protein